MKRFTGHTERWGEFVDVKINAPEVLERELARSPKKGVILIGSVTDGYQPIEKKYKVTRTILEILAKYDFPVSILTKSDLVTRDIDLLRRFSDCDVGLTITTLDSEVAKNFEPRSSFPHQRLEALKILHDVGIKTYCFIGPILPEFTDLRLIFAALQGKVNFVMAESLNMKCGNWQGIRDLLEKKYPHYLQLYQSKFDRRYWDKVGSDLRKLAEEFEIPLRGFYRH
jgi:DNA repair photolyase